MIDYDPHKWWSHFFDLKGSMVREIAARVATCTAWSAVVVAIDQYVVDVSISPIAHQLVGTAVGLLLVFRTNASYDRFWEGRRMWGNIINESRNLGRSAAVYLQGVPDLRKQLIEQTILFSYATMHRLRGERGVAEATKFLSPEELGTLTTTGNIPLQVTIEISNSLKGARDRGQISDYVLMTLDNNVQLLIDYLGACERIEKTPLPFAYMVHLRRVLIMYCFTLPFALVGAFEWATVLDTFLVAYTFFGIEEIGVEIEGPFGRDENDLPLERFCQLIEKDLLEAIGERKAEGA